MIREASNSIVQLQEIIDVTQKKLDTISHYFEKIHQQIQPLKDAANNENLWENPQEATKILKELHAKEAAINNFNSNKQAFDEFKKLSIETIKSCYITEELELLLEEAKRLSSIIGKEYIKTLFTDENDHLPCFIEIKSGDGGTEAQDWAEMLLNMYYKYASSKYKVDIINYCPKDVGIDEATLQIMGPPESFPYGYFKGETGSHRLARPSPYNKNNKRHTSFADVFVGPIKDIKINIEILEKDLRIDTYRASGAGGQHVNKTDSAVRITHLPTGIVVQSQSDRSQHRNKAEALKALKLKLYAMEEKRQKIHTNNKVSGGWGHQIRSYVLYDSRITDLRTGFESYQPERTLNGDLEPFLQAYIHHLIDSSN